MTAELVHGICLGAPIWAEVLLTGIWQGLLLTLLAGLCLKACPSVPAKARFMIWAAILLLLASLPAISLWFMYASPLRLAHYARVGTAAAASPALHLGIVWAIALDSLWVTASFSALLILAWNLRQVRSLARTSTLLPPELYSDELQRILGSAKGRHIEIRLSDQVDAPGAVGFFHPAIILPQWLWREIGAAELKQIVLHEVAHLRRGDDWSNLLQKFLRALCPLNPALLWVERRLCFEREAACDDAVLQASGNPRGYAACLTRLAEARLLRRHVSLAPGAWRGPSELTRRVHRILNSRGCAGPLLTRGMVAASLAVSIGCALLLAQSPQIVSFDQRAEPAVSGIPVREPAFRAASRPPAAKLELARLVVEGARSTPSKIHPRKIQPAKTPQMRQMVLTHSAVFPQSPQVQVLRVSGDLGESGGSWFVLTVWRTQTAAPVGVPEGSISLPDHYVAFSPSERWIIIQI